MLWLKIQESIKVVFRVFKPTDLHKLHVLFLTVIGERNLV